MNQQSKMLASVGGLAVAAAVVVGAVLGAANRPDAPAQQPAGQPIVTATVTTSVSTSASHSTVAAAQASSLVRKAPVKRAAVQGAAVTDPTSTPPAVVNTVTQPPIQDLGSGTTDADGVRRAPAPTSHAPHPSVPVFPSPTGSSS